MDWIKVIFITGFDTVESNSKLEAIFFNFLQLLQSSMLSLKVFSQPQQLLRSNFKMSIKIHWNTKEFQL